MLIGNPLTAPVTKLLRSFASSDAVELAEACRASARQQDASYMVASRKTKLSESKAAVLQAAIADALRPRAAEFAAVRASLLGVAASACGVLCRAALQPKKLSADEFEALFAPFRDAGIEMPTRSELLDR